MRMETPLLLMVDTSVAGINISCWDLGVLTVLVDEDLVDEDGDTFSLEQNHISDQGAKSLAEALDIRRSHKGVGAGAQGQFGSRRVESLRQYHIRRHQISD